MLAGELFRAGAASYAFTGLILTFNLVAGIATARALGPEGRGASVAIVMVTQVMGQLAALGATPSLSYHISRRPGDAAALFGTWAALLLPVAILTTVVAELVLPVVFAAQDDETLLLGRIFLLNIVLVLWGQLTNGLLLGTHDFLVYNALRFLQPALAAVSYVVLWQLDLLTVTSSLVVWTATMVIALAIATSRVLLRIGMARPRRELTARSVWFGVRAHGDAVAGSLNTRLDLVILPAYVAASSVGLYSVAANISLIVNQFAGAFSAVLLPSAARDQSRAPRTVVQSLQVTVLLAGLAAAGLFALAGPALEFVYGRAFGAAAPALRILLPGALLYAGSVVLAAGLHGAGRPFTATVAQVSGAVITLVGLVVFLPGGSIETAAIVSTTAYGTVFLASLVAYLRVSGLTPHQLVRPPQHPPEAGPQPREPRP